MKQISVNHITSFTVALQNKSLAKARGYEPKKFVVDYGDESIMKPNTTKTMKKAQSKARGECDRFIDELIYQDAKEYNSIHFGNLTKDYFYILTQRMKTSFPIKTETAKDQKMNKIGRRKFGVIG